MEILFSSLQFSTEYYYHDMDIILALCDDVYEIAGFVWKIKDQFHHPKILHVVSRGTNMCQKELHLGRL